METVQDLRNAFVSNAKMFADAVQTDAVHEKILEIYNSITPLPRGYAVRMNDAWCATFVSAVAKSSGLDQIFPFECSCYYMTQGLIKEDQWIEDDAYIPEPGDIIMYDWKDGANYATTDNIGVPGHVGIIELVNMNTKTITVIEGNMNNKVGRRIITVNDRYIRGFGVLKWEDIVNMEEDHETMTWLKNTGLYVGDGSGRYRWNEEITRLEMGIVLKRFYDKYIKKENQVITGQKPRT